ncbi:ras-related protein rab-44 [Limosa lapponica baueri]|uniref:Ras-related protein rab-44 n=1 Tax=Limosa lapponica baueri TaxID=1758121 RepID=A0A2I0TPH1_LIMLA|nr:ras-related protein rab-44 [Limosa lapponica baueri]
MEELELVFDGLDAAGTGRLSIEEFTAGLRQFLSSQKASRDHRRRKTASRRVRLVLPSPMLEEVDSEERRHFAAFMDQLGTDNVSEEQEIWQLWVKLRQDEPQLLGNLEDFLAKMRHRIQEARSKKEALEVTLNRRVAEHDKEVQQLCEALEQQIQQEQQRLQQEVGHHQRLLSGRGWKQKSEKYHSEMRIRLGSQSDKPKAKSTHQVVWEMPPAEISLLGALRRASSAEEDPFPELLKEEHFSDQSSLLREMNDAIAALSKQLKPQAPGAPPTLADAAQHPRDDAEPQTELEAATAHGTTPGVLQEAVPGHIGHQPVEGDLKEGPAAAELRAPDVTQAGASVGAGHCRAQEPGAEQGESPEEAQKMLSLQGKGAGVKELTLNVAEHPQGAPGESMEAGEQALMEVEGEGWMQEKARDPGEAEEVALGWGQDLEAGLGPPEAGLAAGWQLVIDELGLAVAPAEHTQPLGTGLGEEAHPPSGLSEKLERNPGERLEPEPPSPGEARMGAAHGDGVFPEVTGAPGPGMLEEEHVGAEVQPQGQTMDAKELPAQAQHGGSSRAGAEEGDVEVLQPQGESERGEAVLGGSVGPEVPVAVPPSDLQEGRAGPDVPPLEARSSDVNMQQLPEVEADLQPPSEASSLDTEQGGSVAPGVEPLDQVDKPELVEMVEAEDSRADMELRGGPSLETLQGGEDIAAVQLGEEAEDGPQGQDEHELPHETVADPWGAGVGQGEGAGAGVEPWEEAGILDTLEARKADANVQLIAEVDEFKLTPGWGTEVDLQLSSEVSSLGKEQGGRVTRDIEPLDQADKPELVEMEAEDSQADTQLSGGPSIETPQERGHHAALQLGEEAEDGAQGQDEHGLPHEPVLHPHGVTVRQGEGAGADMQPPEEAEILGTLEDQSTDANVQLIAEVDELKLTPGGSKKTDLQPLSEADDLWTEQGGSVAPDVQPLDQVDKPELVEMVEAEDSQADMELHGAEATLCPEGDAAAEGSGLETKLAALTGPNGQVPGDTRPLELPQGERTVAEGKPLDGAQDLEVVQGERLEAGSRTLVETQDLGLKQGHDVSALASPVSKVPVQITTLKLETVMQKDVLVPDVLRLGASGQAAQSEPQEQVLAQADKVRLHTASQQPEAKPPRAMETEQVAAGPAEPPKQEVPPVSTLHQQVQQEGSENDQLGMVLGDKSLGDAANNSLQLQRKLLREQSKDLGVGQWEKQQEVGQKMSQKGEPSPGEPGAVTADGTGAAPRGSSEASLDPDHLYNVLFIGDSHVGKTSFLYRLHANAFNPQLTATVGLDYQVKNLMVDNKRFALRLWDSAGQERYRSITKQFFRKADGVVLMYDITSEYSFSDTRYWLSCIQEHQLTFYECSAASGHNVAESMVSLVRDYSSEAMELSANELSIYDKLSETIDLVRQTGHQCGMSEQAIEKFIKQLLERNEPQRGPPRYPLLVALYKEQVLQTVLALRSQNNLACLFLGCQSNNKCQDWWAAGCRQNTSTLPANCTVCSAVKSLQIVTDLGELSEKLQRSQPFLIKTGQHLSYEELKHFQSQDPDLAEVIIEENSAELWSCPFFFPWNKSVNKTRILQEFFPTSSLLSFPKTVSLESCFLIRHPDLGNKSLQLVGQKTVNLDWLQISFPSALYGLCISFQLCV